jgi:hypothetical protein
MKTWRLSVALFGAALLCGSAVMAGEANKATIETSQTLNVDGTTLNPGNYRVEWDGTGPNVQVKILQGKKTVATVPAHLEQQQNKNVANAYGSMKGPDGTQQLTAIYIGGRYDVLQLQTRSANQQQQSSNPGAK